VVVAKKKGVDKAWYSEWQPCHIDPLMWR